jgi:hypothetical protein
MLTLLLCGQGQNGSSIISTLIFNFEIRVAADGGTFEAQNCLNTTLNYLNSITSLVGDFKERVYADGGVVEAQECLVTTINNLNNI